MYDALTGRFTFACPARGETAVPLSAFRRLERLPGAAHPAVYRIRFACACGDEHDGLASHDELDWAPLGLRAGQFVNLMTSRLEPAASELGELALLAPGEQVLGVAVVCPSCATLSVNLVSHAHVDLPFHHDRSVGVLEHVFAADVASTVEAFRDELYSSRFDERRLDLG